MQQVLNRGESYYHKLHKAVFLTPILEICASKQKVNSRFGTIVVVIANCIVFYNTLILSNMLRRQVENGPTNWLAGSLAPVSPVAWQHINFYGRYEFTKSFQPIDIDTIVQELVSRSGSTPSNG